VIPHEIREEMRAELERVYEFVAEKPPTINGVIDDVLMSLARDLRSDADELAGCDSVDACTATAIYLRALADSFDPKRRADS
jgi:hypothetical protein